MKAFTIYNDELDYENMSIEDMEYYDSDYFYDKLNELKVPTENPILAIADMGLWNGRKQGYRECGRMLSECLTVGSSDYNKLYFDGFNIRKTSKHHDGTNYILFREVRPNRDIDKFIDMIYNGEHIDNKTLNYYTRSLKRYLTKIYG